MALVLSPPPAIVALLQYQDPGSLSERQLVRLLGLIVVLDDGGAECLTRVHAARTRGVRPAAAADGRAVRWQGFRAGAFLYLLFDAGRGRNIIYKILSTISN